VLARTSRLVAKVDSAAVQDGFQLYLHGFVVAADGTWTVVQQGMNASTARRYHWLSEGLSSFVEEPHTAIEGENIGEIINLTDRRARASRDAQVNVIREGPDRALALIAEAAHAVEPAPVLPQLVMPAHHDVRAEDVLMRRMHGALAAAHSSDIHTYDELLLTPGIGPRTVASLALVGEVIFGTASRFSDPARFSLAHGGKDGHPFPVPIAVFDRTISVLKSAVDRAKLGNDEKLGAIRRLDQQARAAERDATGPSFEELVFGERRDSDRYDGRTVFTKKPKKQPAAKGQLDLFGKRPTR
jgi:uncharacterized protein